MSEGAEDQAIPSTSWHIGQEIHWDAPWVEVYLRVELPFWMMVGPTDLEVEVNGHVFPVCVSDHFYEYGYDRSNDSKSTIFYRGARKTKEELQGLVNVIRTSRPNAEIFERKCKTIVRITSRCNSDVAHKAHKARQVEAARRGVSLYLEELSRAHLPVLNRVIRSYRLATYDYFVHEVTAWDVPFWYIDFCDGAEVTATLHPYKAWDQKIIFVDFKRERASSLALLDQASFRNSLDLIASPGEFELLDALNLFERGDHAGAIRRAVTALEVLVEASLRQLITANEGAERAAAYLEDTEASFEKRLGKLCGLTKRKFLLWKRVKDARTLRHDIVHNGARMQPGDKGRWEMMLDVCRWAYTWLENDDGKRDLREYRIAMRSQGREMHAGVFSPSITQEGVQLSPIVGP